MGLGARNFATKHSMHLALGRFASPAHHSTTQRSIGYGNSVEGLGYQGCQPNCQKHAAYLQTRVLQDKASHNR
jgi:hypothetical protein